MLYYSCTVVVIRLAHMYLAALARRADASCYQHRSIDRYLLFQCRQKLSEVVVNYRN